MNQNWIKRQAREHEGFKRRCIQGAQALHRVDMSLRLGLLRSTYQVEKETAKELAETAAKRHKHDVHTVKTEAETIAEAEAEAARKEAERQKAKEPAKPPPKPKIKPLSEARAIDTGANFISEAFLFMVASGLIVFESMRAKKKADTKREDMEEKIKALEESERAAKIGLLELEKEVLRLRAKESRLLGPKKHDRILSRAHWAEDTQVEAEPEPEPWYSRLSTIFQNTTEDGEKTVETPTQTTTQPLQGASLADSKPKAAPGAPATQTTPAPTPASSK